MENLCRSNNEGTISLCTATASQNEFLYMLYRESRSDLLWITGLSEEQRESIVQEQFRIEHDQILKVYPGAELNIVMLGKEPIGRLYVYYGENAVRIIEIGLLEKYRGQGIGRMLIAGVVDNAKKIGKKVTLQVAWFNQRAYSFYNKLGFEIVENNGVFYEMQYVEK